jgi:hypothetical protein
MLYLLFAALLSLLLSCTTGAPDVPVCTELDMGRGWCTNSISDKEFYIDDKHPYEGKTWWELRPTFVMMPAASYVKFKAFIIKTCKQYGCNQKEVGSWDRRMNQMDQHLQEKGADVSVSPKTESP